MDFTGNEIVGKALDDGLAVMQIESDYDIDRRGWIMVVVAHVFETWDAKEKGHPRTSFSLSSKGEWHRFNDFGPAYHFYIEPNDGSPRGFFTRQQSQIKEAQSLFLDYIKAMTTVVENPEAAKVYREAMEVAEAGRRISEKA